MRVTVNFSLKRSKSRADGKCPVYVRCTMNNQRFELSTGVFVVPESWNDSRQLLTGKTEEAKILNNRLGKIRTRVHTPDSWVVASGISNTAIRAGKPSWLAAFKLNFRVPLTPTPMNNVMSLRNRAVLPKLLPFPAFSPQPVSDKRVLQTTLPEPKRLGSVLPAAQWLDGEGARSWFGIVPANDEKFEITRFSPEGKVECQGKFRISNKQLFRIKHAFRFDHLSHCRKVRIRQENNTIEFRRIEKKASGTKLKKVLNAGTHLQPVGCLF